MSDFIIETPPAVNHAGGRRSTVTDDVVTFCRANPGQWVRVASGLSATTANGRWRLLKQAGLDVSVRKLDDGTFGVWARWSA